ncbi:MAG: glycerol-3-phosphate acyltransferase [Chloroflexi bacterium]|nr:glycerol-3-phosphate acyltransferase [Chloroflexota bacterium]
MMLSLESLGIVLLGYLLGGFPTAYLVSKWRLGKDIRSVGNRNPGAGNVSREVGRLFGVLVFVVDAAKGMIAVFVGQRLGAPDIAVYIAAFVAILGHNFSPFLKFSGGKGAATAIGVSALLMWQVTAVAAAVGLVMLALTRHIFWSAGFTLFAFNALAIITRQPLGLVMLSIGMTLLIGLTNIIQHRSYLLTALADRDWRHFLNAD